MTYFTSDLNSQLRIRKMRDNMEDYSLLAAWLSNPDVAEFYEGRTNLYSLEMVINKFGPYARGVEPITPCIIERGKEPIGYVQFYRSTPQELKDFKLYEHASLRNCKAVYGFDIFIGTPCRWGQGLGARIISLLAQFLFAHEHAELIVINPQTWNIRALRCYEKCGFQTLTILPQYELHDGSLMDCAVMYLQTMPKTSL